MHKYYPNLWKQWCVTVIVMKDAKSPQVIYILRWKLHTQIKKKYDENKNPHLCVIIERNTVAEEIESRSATQQRATLKVHICMGNVVGKDEDEQGKKKNLSEIIFYKIKLLIMKWSQTKPTTEYFIQKRRTRGNVLQTSVNFSSFHRHTHSNENIYEESFCASCSSWGFFFRHDVRQNSRISESHPKYFLASKLSNVKAVKELLNSGL